MCGHRLRTATPALRSLFGHAKKRGQVFTDPTIAARTAKCAGLNLVPMKRKANAWDAFEALHARITHALSDDFDSVFGKNFARAYERALAEVSAKEEDA